jgi:hypothetical protein
MSKHQTVRAIQREIAKVNREIDARIIQRRPYADLALYHKSLLVQMRRVPVYRFGGFGKFLARCASFTL